RYNVQMTFDYDTLENGFIVSIDFKDLAISFDVEVKIENKDLIVSIPQESLIEGQIEKPMLNIDGTTSIKVTKFRLKGVFVFPYFGSNNFEINGYSMIPDGSGALIRYTNNRSQTAYTKRIYGADEGMTPFRSESTTYYLRDELTSSAPVFGVNHGYNQAAFLAQMTKGDAYGEIHSYPYGYNAYTINTTFFKWIVRERYSIQTSSNTSDSFQLINTLPYTGDYEVKYHFLSGEDANYSGMANKYQELLLLNQSTKQGTSFQLALLGLDYKGGMFGKDFVKMTSYEDVIMMVQELKDLGLEGIDVLYQGFNQGGLYDNLKTISAASLLGGTKGFMEMKRYLDSIGSELSLQMDPMITYSATLGSKAIKKITFTPFQTKSVRTSLFAFTYYMSPSDIAAYVLKSSQSLAKLDSDSLYLSTVGKALFTFRQDGQNIDRTSTKDMIMNQLAMLSMYKLTLDQPNSYLWKFTSTYVQAPIESNKYAYVTDSIPFLSLVLNGSLRQYSPYYNYVSDYELFGLRLIEYGIDPSFFITKESTHKLRYTNSAYIYTSQYSLWKDVMISQGLYNQQVSSIIGGRDMLSHSYISSGVAKIVYEGGYTVYVNYQATPFEVVPGVSIGAKSSLVVSS
ncbi:MAG: DUF5696 domain-containing protein, partial [Candidatus Izemoplasmatales bacterium]|nr:DUF5696 domain-containing protein [Candidatus Izemoplasmatales bacterium]